MKVMFLNHDDVYVQYNLNCGRLVGQNKGYESHCPFVCLRLHDYATMIRNAVLTTMNETQVSQVLSPHCTLVTMRNTLTCSVLSPDLPSTLT